MVRGCVGLKTSAANMWVSMMGVAFGIGPLESTRLAKLSLRATLDEIEETEQDLNAQLAKYLPKIKAFSEGGASAERMDMGRFKASLMQCKKIRMKLAALSKKKLALENHMDTLDNSELNQHVLYSMQKTSHALKGMGLDKALESVDRVMMDLEENHGDMTSIQNSLASTFDTGDDFDWEGEMEILLNSDTFVSSKKVEVSAPVTSNAIVMDVAPTEADDGAAKAASAASAAGADAPVRPLSTEQELAVFA